MLTGLQGLRTFKIPRACQQNWTSGPRDLQNLSRLPAKLDFRASGPSNSLAPASKTGLQGSFTGRQAKFNLTPSQVQLDTKPSSTGCQAKFNLTSKTASSLSRTPFKLPKQLADATVLLACELHVDGYRLEHASNLREFVFDIQPSSWCEACA